MTNDEVMRKALHRAFSLGQTYWQQADSESYAANKRADVTQAKFNTLVEETLAHISARPEPQAAVSEEQWPELPEARIVSYQTDSVMRTTELRTYDETDMREYARAVLAASRHVPVGKPVAWIRWCSDGLYEGPLMDKQIEDVRKRSGAWTPLYEASPLPVGEPRQEEGERGGPSGVERMEQALRDQEAHFEKVYAAGVGGTDGR